jgi:hypothetical protein
VFVGALAVGAYLAKPFAAASVAFDSQAAALYFSRILDAQRLEAFVSTTPKPLITAVFGVLYQVTHDWRALSWATLLADAAAVALTAHLVRRELGWPAWTFAAAALSGCLALLYDVGFALATPWALLFIAAAGIVGTGARPRPVLAGVLVMLAVLVRLETLILVALVTAIVGWKAGTTRSTGQAVPRAWLVLVPAALAAIAVMCLHDVLLTGDPFFWTTVSSRYSASAGLPIRDPAQQVTWLVARYVTLWPLTGLALIGFVRLVRLRSWPLVVGVVAFGPGTAAFLVLLAAEHLYVPPRYMAPIDIAAIVAASAGPGWLLLAATERLPAAGRRLRSVWGTRSLPSRASGWLRALAVAAVCVVIAVAVAWPSGILDRGLRARIAGSRWLALDTLRIKPAVAAAVGAIPGARDRVAQFPVTGGRPILLVPTLVKLGLTLDLDLPLSRIDSLTPADVDPAAGRPAIGQIAFHDRHAQPPYPSLEVSSPTPYGTALAVPLAFDIQRQYWVVTIQPR